MISCQESQKSFSPYLDGVLPRGAVDMLDEHLSVCPVCRGRLEATRSLVRGLSLVTRPAPPANLASDIRASLVIERAARAASEPAPLHERAVAFVKLYLMPYAVGAVYSMILFVAVFGALRQQLRVLRNLAEARYLEDTNPSLASGGGYDVTRPLSPDLAVAARAQFTTESPTLNPRGALAKLTLAPASDGNPEDDDMIVVADVYGNGTASLAEVVEPPRNRRMVEELQDALRKNPAFVPASLDRRPQTMRVVFVLQKMNVGEGSF